MGADVFHKMRMSTKWEKKVGIKWRNGERPEDGKAQDIVRTKKTASTHGGTSFGTKTDLFQTRKSRSAEATA